MFFLVIGAIIFTLCNVERTVFSFLFVSSYLKKYIFKDFIFILLGLPMKTKSGFKMPKTSDKGSFLFKRYKKFMTALKAKDSSAKVHRWRLGSEDTSISGTGES